MSTAQTPKNRKVITEHCGTFSVSEAAERLGFGKRAVYQAVQNGEIPVVRLGAVVRIPKAWIERKLAGEVEEVA